MPAPGRRSRLNLRHAASLTGLTQAAAGWTGAPVAGQSCRAYREGHEDGFAEGYQAGAAAVHADESRQPAPRLARLTHGPGPGGAGLSRRPGPLQAHRSSTRQGIAGHERSWEVPWGKTPMSRTASRTTAARLRCPAVASWYRWPPRAL